MYQLHRPIRKNLSTVALWPSLYVIWAWMNHLEFGRPFPSDIEIPDEIKQAARGLEKPIYAWDLALLAKELLIYSPDFGVGITDFRKWNSFARSVDLLKELEEEIPQHYDQLFQEHIFIHMHRLAHLQFPWQRTSRLIVEVSRYMKIFGTSELDSIL